MSIETWLEEFMPVPADKCPAGEEAAHGIKKWTGCLPENLAKHEIDIEGVSDFLYSGSCALCISYMLYKSCEECPGLIANQKECDDESYRTSPYFKARLGDVKPLLKWLQKAKEFQDAENRRDDQNY